MAKRKRVIGESEYLKAGGDERVPDMARSLALLGASQEEMATAFGVCRKTITTWSREYPLFKQAILDGRVAADAIVGKRLYERALGYDCPEDKIFYDSKEAKPVIVPTVRHYPPDTTAAIFWLKNRHPDKWRDRHVVDQTTTHEAGDSLKAVLDAVDGRTKSV